MGFFEVKDVEPQWKKVIGIFRERADDEVIDYEELGNALGIPGISRSRLQSVTRQAGKHLLREDDRAIEAVNNVGYRIVRPEEHVKLSHKQQNRASKALVRGRNTVVHVDYNQLSQEGRRLAELTARAFSVQIEAVRRLDVRQTRLERAVDAVAVRVERNVGETEDLKRRLEKIEKRVGQDDTAEIEAGAEA